MTLSTFPQSSVETCPASYACGASSACPPPARCFFADELRGGSSALRLWCARKLRRGCATSCRTREAVWGCVEAAATASVCDEPEFHCARPAARMSDGMYLRSDELHSRKGWGYASP